MILKLISGKSVIKWNITIDMGRIQPNAYLQDRERKKITTKASVTLYLQTRQQRTSRKLQQGQEP